MVLHVEVDEDALGVRDFEDGHEALHQLADRAFGVDGVDAGREGGDLDRDVDARDRAEMVGLEPRLGLPLRHGGGEVLDQVEVLGAEVIGFDVGDAGLAEQVDGEGDAVVPHFLETWEGGFGVGAGDESRGHAGDLLLDLSGGEALHEPAGLECGGDDAGHGDAGLGEVVVEVVEDLLGRLELGEAVDEAEHLNLEVRVLHGPVHQGVGVELRGQKPGLVGAGSGQHLGSQFEDPRFAARVGGLGRGEGGRGG